MAEEATPKQSWRRLFLRRPEAVVRYSGFSSSWRKGYRAVYILRLIAASPMAGVRGGKSLTYAAAVALAPSMFAAVTALVAPGLGPAGWRDFIWVGGLAAMNALLIAAAWMTWDFVDARSAPVDEMLNATSDARVRRYFEKAFSPLLQGAFPAVGLVGSVAFLWLVRDLVSAAVTLTASSYVAVAWTALIGGNVLYWVFAGSGVVHPVIRDEQLHLRAYDPASTPGLRLLASGLGYTAVTLIIGTFGISLVGFVAPGTVSLPAVQGVLIGFFVALVAGLIFAVLVPLIAMHRAIERARHVTLATLQRHLQEEPTRWRSSRSALVAAYRSVADAPGWPFPTAAGVQIGAAVLGSILAFVLSLVV